MLLSRWVCGNSLQRPQDLMQTLSPSLLIWDTGKSPELPGAWGS